METCSCSTPGAAVPICDIFVADDSISAGHCLLCPSSVTDHSDPYLGTDATSRAIRRAPGGRGYQMHMLGLISHLVGKSGPIVVCFPPNLPARGEARSTQTGVSCIKAWFNAPFDEPSYGLASSDPNLCDPGGTFGYGRSNRRSNAFPGHLKTWSTGNDKPHTATRGEG